MTSQRIVRYPTRRELFVRRNRGLSTADRIRRSYVVEANGCWRWTRGLTGPGYGHLSMQSVYYQAHRLSYILHVGHDVPKGLFLDHLCRNRWCVNPTHLEPVTHQENVRRGAGTRVTPAEVQMIRAEYAAGMSQRTIGKARGIDHSTVSRIVRFERWPDVGERTVAA